MTDDAKASLLTIELMPDSVIHNILSFFALNRLIPVCDALFVTNKHFNLRIRRIYNTIVVPRAISHCRPLKLTRDTSPPSTSSLPASLEQLPNAVVASILSYFPIVNLLKVCHSLFATNQSFHRRIKAITSTMDINADLTKILPRATVAQYKILLSIATFGFNLTKLHVIVGERDLPLLVELMKKNILKTTKLKSFAVISSSKLIPNVLFPYMSYPSGIKQHPISMLLAYKLSMYSKFHIWEDNEKINPFMAEDWWETGKFNHFIASHSPDLTHLRTIFHPMSKYQEDTYVFQNLKSLCVLHIATVYGRQGAGMNRLTSIVQRTPNLKFLELSNLNGCSSSSSCYNGNLTLRSNSLTHVNVEFLGRGMYFREVVCPKLEHFLCAPSMQLETQILRGNGVQPGGIGQTPDHFLHPSTYDGTKIVMGDSPWFGMQVPSECVVEYSRSIFWLSSRQTLSYPFFHEVPAFGRFSRQMEFEAQFPD